MPDRPPRRFTLLDAMILVAAVALGLGLSRAWSHFAEKQRMTLSYFTPPGYIEWVTSATYWTIAAWPVVAAVTPALLVMRLRRPRPSGRRLFAPPGVAACAGATIVMVLECAERSSHTIVAALLYRPAGAVFDEHTEMRLALAALGACSSVVVGFGVAAVWGTMTLSRRWRPEPGWIDRAGRVVGVLWLALIPLRIVFDLQNFVLAR